MGHVTEKKHWANASLWSSGGPREELVRIVHGNSEDTLSGRRRSRLDADRSHIDAVRFAGDGGKRLLCRQRSFSNAPASKISSSATLRRRLQRPRRQSNNSSSLVLSNSAWPVSRRPTTKTRQSLPKTASPAAKRDANRS